MRIVKPIISMIFRGNSLPFVGSTLRISGGKGGYVVRITRRLKGGRIHYLVLTTDRKLYGSVRIATAKTNVRIPINRRALKELFGMLNRAVSGKRPVASSGG